MDNQLYAKMGVVLQVVILILLFFMIYMINQAFMWLKFV